MFSRSVSGTKAIDDGTRLPKANSSHVFSDGPIKIIRADVWVSEVFERVQREAHTKTSSHPITDVISTLLWCCDVRLMTQVSTL